MESLSRPFHTRKLSNASSFSGKNAYDGVFSGHRQKYDGVPAAKVEDYREIFSSSQASSSIPVLDLSTFEESSDGSSSRLRSSKPDYSKIFGGFRDEDIAVSYEELFARDKAGAPSSTRPTSQDSDNLSHQSFDALKQFNMSYHKISQRGKDDLERTTHVTQLHAIPGFTCFINETDPPQKMEDDKQKASVINNGDSSLNSNNGGFPEKQTSESVIKRKNKYQRDESFSDDNYFKTSNPFRVSSSSSSNGGNHKDYPKKPIAKSDASESAPEEFSPGYLDEELDVNSAASISAAALKKAIEKAQESIRIAKESVGRKKEGLRSFSNRSFKDSLKVKGRMANVAAGEEQKRKDGNVKGGFGIYGKVSESAKNHEYGGTSVSPDFKDGEKLFVAKKVLDEIHGKISESAKKCDIPVRSSHELRDSKIIRNSKEVLGETEATSLDSAIRYEYETCSSKVVNTGKSRIITTEFELENLRKNMSSEDDKHESLSLFHESRENGKCEAPQEDESSAQGSTGFLLNGSCDKKVGDSEDSIEDNKSRESKENKDEVRLSDAHKLLKDSNNLTVSQEVEDEKKITQGLLENEKQEEGLEEEHIEKVENAEINGKNSYDKARDKGFEEAFEWLENEEELKEDISTKSHKEEDFGEKFYDVCEVEINESTQTYAHTIEKGEVFLKEDCEMKHKDEGEETGKRLNEVLELETDGDSSSGNNRAEESERVDSTHHASNILDDTKESCKFDTIDNIVEASEEVDDVSVDSVQATGDSSESNVEERESMEAVYTSEEQEIFEKTSTDQSASEDNEDERELKTENLPNCGLADVDLETYEPEENSKSESYSYSYTVLGMEIEPKKTTEKNDEKSDLGATHEERPKNRITEEIGAYQEPNVLNEDSKRRQYRENKDEISEREREKNKIAVERAIREARERAFLEARERAERAAVERANAEVRERVMAEAREKVAKASVGSKLSSERTSAQNKLRAERAAVERATSEARQRALEKAMSQKSTSEMKAEANGIRQSSSSSDLNGSNGTSAESAQRSKAKLEKHSRIMERAAKALAEKEKRDLLAQKEQAERNRLAESLDADIKRWSSGKEGNLRALLSTLQYILGSESGWQAVSLTEIITTSAVKKAYRKATLCVHPDKLQQRGATIQQKYICEKVFDLLKAAWNRFNSEER